MINIEEILTFLESLNLRQSYGTEASGRFGSNLVLQFVNIR